MKKVFKISQVFCLIVLVLLMATSCNVTDGMFETFTTPLEETTPEGTIPDETTPDETTPDETTPDETTPDETTPDETTPQEHTHTWGNWVVVIEAKCFDAGLKQRYCTECNYPDAAPINAIGYHTFDHDCDTTCNSKGCGYVREIKHQFDHDCDTDCNVCGLVREVPDHVYDNACDTDCNVCGAKRSVPPHIYDRDCDATCNVCGYIRQTEHQFDHDCDTTCNVEGCGFSRSIKHNFVNAVCTVCGFMCKDHSIVDGKCQLCGYIPVFKNASVYDNDGDGVKDSYLFTPILPEKFLEANGGIHVWAGDNESPEGSFNIVTLYDMPYWYCTEYSDHYLLYTVEVFEAGIYEMAIHLSIKDNKERGAKYTINEGTANEYVFETSHQFVDVYEVRENDSTMSSYMYGIQVKLVAGKNTIKIQSSSKSPKCQHFRDFYFVKVGEWTPGEPCETHFCLDGKCQLCGFIPVFENASVYDYDNDGQNDIFYFTPILPEKFLEENGAVHVWAGDYIKELSSAHISSTELCGIRHWYCTEGTGEYFVIKVTVAEAGVYEMAIHMRMKDSKERGTKYTINEGTANEYSFETSFQFATEADAFAARENDNTMSSYMFGINVNLVQGDNYIKIQDSSKSPRNQQYRDFYFVKVGEWTLAPEETPEEPATLTAEEAIALGNTFEKTDIFNGKYYLTEEYYYVTLTLNIQANPATGFARATLEGVDMIISVAAPADYVEGTYQLGDTVTFLAQVGCVNSSVTSTCKEARLFNATIIEVVPATPAQ